MDKKVVVPTNGHIEVTGFEQSSIQFDLKSLAHKAPKRGAYRKLHKGAYRAKLLLALGESVMRISLGEKPKQGIARFNVNTQLYELHFGIGRRCVRFENEYIPIDRTPEFSTSYEVLVVLRRLIKITQSGAFDAALDELLNDRQNHSRKMIRGKAVDSFVPPAQNNQ